MVRGSINGTQRGQYSYKTLRKAAPGKVTISPDKHGDSGGLVCLRSKLDLADFSQTVNEDLALLRAKYVQNLFV